MTCERKGVLTASANNNDLLRHLERAVYVNRECRELVRVRFVEKTLNVCVIKVGLLVFNE